MDRNLFLLSLLLLLLLSLSVRRAWIEITLDVSERESLAVALRKESVDRNTPEEVKDYEEQTVALRKESVDRNQGVHYDNYNLHVALRKESVDRNFLWLMYH